MVAEVDVDGNGSIDFQEFLTLMSKKMKEHDVEEEFMECYKLFNKDHEGRVRCDELRYVLTNLGDKLPMEMVNEMIDEADVEKDGRLNYEEFCRMMLAK